MQLANREQATLDRTQQSYRRSRRRSKSSSAQSSPHKTGIKPTKNLQYSAISVGLTSGIAGETRPYSAKNSSYSRKKTRTLIKMLKNEGDLKNKSFGTKSKKGDMKRSSSKKSPNASNQDFNPSLYTKFVHPNGIGLYGPGKIKLNKEKPSSSSRGSARWNKSPSHSKVNGKLMQ